MVFGLLNKIVDLNAREIKKFEPIVSQINSHEDKVKKLKDQDFPKKTEEFRKRIEKGEDVMSILPEAFALVREAALRTIGLRHYDVQMIAAASLAQGKVAEQKTGEGKTLSAVPALYLHALTGKAVHLVTVNDYLARRDAGWMGGVFAFLGMRVSSLINETAYVYDTEYQDDSVNDYRLLHLRPATRQEAYLADVVYGINSEFGFDYLRDNMSEDKRYLVQRGFYYAIIDEVDSVLIDEARTPHIISIPDDTPSQKYIEYARVVERLTDTTDYVIDEKQRSVHLTESGMEKLEKFYGIKNIYENDFETVFHIEAALKANTLFHNNKEYIVRDGQVILVDEFTGRLMEGRRLSEGIHQAIEAKEGVAVQQETKTAATISLQNYFRMYEHLAGMTGTALTESEEFKKIYNLDVVVIPTHNKIQRIDENDLIYKTVKAKYTAVALEIEKAWKKGQPVLVGTTSIENNEIISEYLKKIKVPHEVLNAKNHLKEALIISNAGRKGAVTVATNMAGRGVDIILGGQPPSEYELEYQSAKGKEKYKKEYEAWKKGQEEIKKSGGLLVVGTEKHESRRIDNQLRGRSGRQGDPGRSIFIISLEDDLMRIFGGDQIANLMNKFNFPEDQPLTHSLVTRVITQAQVKVEGFNFEQRKRTVDYDDVLNKQRSIIYDIRRKIIVDEVNHEELFFEKLNNAIDRIIQFNIDQDGAVDYEKVIDEFRTIVPFDDHSRKHILENVEKVKTDAKIKEIFLKICEDLHNQRKEAFGGQDHMNRLLQFVSLKTIDTLWMNHLTDMDDLRSGVGLRGYAQKDPLVEYKNEAFQKFEQLVTTIDDEVVHRVYRTQVNLPQPVVKEPKKIQTNQSAAEIGAEAAQEKKQKELEKKVKDDGDKLSRNDPCPCGSGKKWKKCHYPIVP